MTRLLYCETLAKYIPKEACNPIADLIYGEPIQLTVTYNRKTKLGDYRPPFQGKGHRISINSGMNKFAALITLIHEIAHYQTWIKYQNKVKAHGAEWKSCYAELLDSFLALNIFPTELEKALQAHIESPKAASCSDINLLKALKKYDNKVSLTLEDIPLGSVFYFRNRVFKKDAQNRTRYKCTDLNNKRTYLIHGLADIELV
jgi:SprT protein